MQHKGQSAKMSDDQQNKSRDHQTSLVMLNAILETGQSAVKSMALINGGASVALLAFIGNVVANANTSDFPIDGIAYALLKFVFGTGSAGLTMAFRYLSQECYSCDFELQGMNNPKWKKFRAFGSAFKYAAIVTGIASLGLFFCGGILAFQTLIAWSN